MSGPKRNPDKLNTIGVVVVGICGAVLVYVTIVALQAFYMDDTAEVQTMADYGGQDTTAKGHKAVEMQNITETSSNPASGGTQTYHIPINYAMRDVVADAKRDPSHLIPALPASTKPTIEPIYGRPKLLGAGAGAPAPAPPPAPEGSGSAGSGSAGSGSAAPASGSATTPVSGGNGH